jgi:hypothetical protein
VIWKLLVIMLGVMAAAASYKFSTELVKMSKFEMAQVRRTLCACGDVGRVVWWPRIIWWWISLDLRCICTKCHQKAQVPRASKTNYQLAVDLGQVTLPSRTSTPSPWGG